LLLSLWQSFNQLHDTQAVKQKQIEKHTLLEDREMGTITMQPTFLFAKSSSAFAASSPELLLFFQPLLPLSQQYIFFICLARARPAAPDELLAQHCSVFQSCRPFLLLHLP
jgi:hypothetical protein